jgi:hypothetical protein
MVRLCSAIFIQIYILQASKLLTALVNSSRKELPSLQVLLTTLSEQVWIVSFTCIAAGSPAVGQDTVPHNSHWWWGLETQRRRFGYTIMECTLWRLERVLVGWISWVFVRWFSDTHHHCKKDCIQVNKVLLYFLHQCLNQCWPGNNQCWPVLAFNPNKPLDQVF